MQSVLLSIDRLSAIVGKIFAWFILALTFAIVYEVFARYLFLSPTTWAYDVSYMLYGTLFMMAGAYTLSRNGHVRADFVYRNLHPRRQATIDLVLYALFFVPGMLALIFYGWDFFIQSYRQDEHSAFSPDGPLIWPFKFVIPAAGFIMLLQGLVESARCVVCMRTGSWPQRLHDVEELENLAMAQAAALYAEGKR